MHGPTQKKKKIGKPRRLIGVREVLSLVPYRRVTIWRKMRSGEFPMARELGGKIVWFEDEIAEWLASRPVVKLKELRPDEIKVAEPKNPSELTRRKKEKGHKS
jgi:predicted DNA-binding transcriptional regulator AlpA